MSGRHSGGTNSGLRITALPESLKMIFKLAPRQLNDELALAKAEIKRKGGKLGVAGAFFAVALVFVALLVIGLFVAAIMGLATIMPAWLAALLVSAVCLIIAAIGALIGQRKFKALMPLVPEETIRGLKHDLGIAKEGSAFDAAVLDPNSEQYKAAKAAKEAAAAKAKAEKEAKAAAKPELGPAPTEAELLRRLDERRAHLTEVRDNLGRELDVKTQAQGLLAATQARLQVGKGQLSDKIAGFRSAARSSAGTPTSADGQNLTGQIKDRWKPLAVLAAAASALAILLRKLIKG